MATTKKYTQTFFNFDKPKKKKPMGKIIKMKVPKAAKKTATKSTTPKKTALKKLPANLKGKATLAQLNAARKKGGSISIGKTKKPQSGSSMTFLDKIKKAKTPGKRLTAHGTIYYESRKNRSDKAGSNI